MQIASLRTTIQIVTIVIQDVIQDSSVTNPVCFKVHGLTLNSIRDFPTIPGITLCPLSG